MSDKSIMPFGDNNLRDLVGRFFEDRWSPFDVSSIRSSYPKVDISETDREIIVEADLPGMKSEEVDVEIHEGVLTLRGEHKTEQEQKDKRYYRYERAYGSFARSFVLPSSVDESKIEAEMNEGVLRVVLPKIVEQKKKIAVKSKNK